MSEPLQLVIQSMATLCRKGERIRIDREGGIVVATIDNMPLPPEADDKTDVIDVHFVAVAVDRQKAREGRETLVSLLRGLPDAERLKQGPSYIEVGCMLGDQGLALLLFGVGECLGIWRVITPARMGFEGNEADRMAGAGYVMTDGFRPDAHA